MKLMSLLLAFALLLSGCAAAEKTENDEVEQILSGMSLRDKVAQMMIASFRIWKEVPEDGAENPAEESKGVNITELNDEIREMISRDHFGGILLFAENFTDPEQTLRLIEDL